MANAGFFLLTSAALRDQWYKKALELSLQRGWASSISIFVIEIIMYCIT